MSEEEKSQSIISNKFAKRKWTTESTYGYGNGLNVIDNMKSLHDIDIIGFDIDKYVY